MKSKMYKIMFVGQNGIERFAEYVYGVNRKEAFLMSSASGNLKMYCIRKNTEIFKKILANNPECFYGADF